MFSGSDKAAPAGLIDYAMIGSPIVIFRVMLITPR
jgi:hypothetical protein